MFDGSLAQAWAFGDTLTITFSTPFTYDPADGNLLMTVVSTDTEIVGGIVYFDTNGYNHGGLDGDDYMGRVYETGDIITSGYGLVTDFETGTTTVTTPEPGTFLLLATGLLGLIGVAVRRRRQLA